LGPIFQPLLKINTKNFLNLNILIIKFKTTRYNTGSYGSVNYWKIENSWGTEGPYSDKWFGEYTFQLIVPKKYITNDEKNVWNGEISSSFPIWSQIGSLAI